LLLRQDNADLRLRKYGHRVGLISDEEYQKTLTKQKQIEDEIQRVSNTFVGQTKNVQDFLIENHSSALNSGCSIADLIRRPELNYKMLAAIDPDRPVLPEAVGEQVNINIKYEGYIKRQLKQVEQFRKKESWKIPDDIDYENVSSLRIEARQKLEKYKPISIGQASRISGVSPSDISVLMVYLESKK
ncbi:MAG: tRNA uridine-5-carboxymethylaminomethyl(34) synthesis enzyme MnmG, partial [Eubacterium sp.]|nr:tRNA uridine-5-carboxymethylaminomethyl(34) synthesis enzyme MnmG [Eubacterium sp.]